MMKSLILLIAAMLILMHSTQAQKISISPCGGGAYTTTSNLLRENGMNPHGCMSVIVGLRVVIDLPRLQTGIGVQYGGQSYTYESILDSGSISGVMRYEAVGKFLSPYVFLNYKVKLPRSFAYAGINVGYTKNVTIKVKANLGDRSFGSMTYIPQHPLAKIGIQAGYSLRMSSNCWLYAETGVNHISGKVAYWARYGQFQSWHVEDNTSFWQIPFTVGVNVQIK